MSNASYSFKENSHVIVNQGGEKKVMKKILSVALSTAMAFSMFASVAFGADAKLTPEQQFNALKEAGIMNGFPDGLSHLERTLTRAELAKIIVNSLSLEPVTGVATYKDKGYSANHWAAPYIEAATQAGILQGKDTVKGLFDPSGNVTVQELAKVLVTALKLDVPADANNTASAWAKGYVAAAVEKGLIPDGVNYQAAATRSQAVVAAYAIYEANQVPTVKSYKVVDPKNVEFTMSDGEVVKVALETALEANKETEVKFTYQDREYTHKVTYVTTVAQTVQSVKADNLKQIVVTFDGTVDPETAGNEDNYVIKDRTFYSATLSEDKSSVTLLLDNDNNANFLTNQKEVELEIKNVKNGDGTKTFNQKVKFTPSDVTAPTVKEVVALGTKAFKIKFSEPINPATALASSYYKVDGKAVGASVKFGFPDTVIVQTSLTVGEHKVAVSNVADYSGLKVAPVDNTFTAAEDTAAPEVVSATTKDLKKVIVEFNETIKSVSMDSYANSSSNKPNKIDIDDTKVTLYFNNNINYTENTITLKAVSDYSDNKADREVKVTPVLDTVRPTVTESKIKLDTNGHYIAEVRFSEELEMTSAQNRENYVLKNSDGKIADVNGVDAKGHPHLAPKYDKRVVTVDLGFGLKNEKYTLTISGVKDTAAVGNEIIPVTVDLDVANAQNGEIDRVWFENIPGSTEKFLYVEFNKELATSGEGVATSPAKYKLLKKATGDTAYTEVGQLTDEENNVILISGKTVQIRTKLSLIDANSTFAVKASYIANAEGKYLKQNSSYDLIKEISAIDKIKVKDNVKAISNSEVKVEFESKIDNYSVSDFIINGATPISATVGDGGKSLTLKLASKDELKSGWAANDKPVFKTVDQDYITTQNEYGTKILAETNGYGINDEIKPEIKYGSLELLSATGATYRFALDTTEEVKFNVDRYPGTDFNKAADFEVKAETSQAKYTAVIDSVTLNSTATPGATGLVLEVTFSQDGVSAAPTDLGVDAIFTVKLKDSNEQSKVIVDASDNKNALKGISISAPYNSIK